MADPTDLVTLASIRGRLQRLINRKDLTDSLADDFINLAQSNIERVLRIGTMERVLQAQMDGVTNAIPVPATFLQLIDLFTDDGALLQVEKDEYLRTADCGGQPRIFLKVADRWMFKPKPAAGTIIYVHHYAQSDPLRVDTDRNPLTQAGTSCLLYTAAELAADHFQDDTRAQRFQAKAKQYREELTSQDLDEQFSGPMRLRMPSLDF